MHLRCFDLRWLGYRFFTSLQRKVICQVSDYKLPERKIYYYWVTCGKRILEVEIQGIIFESHCKPRGNKREKSMNLSNFKDFIFC